MQYRSIADLSNIIRSNLSKVHNLGIDLIVGIPRSGMLPANMLALYLNIPMTDIDSFANGVIYQSGERGKLISPNIKNVLVIDDSISSGSALAKAKSKLSHISNYHIVYGAAIARTSSKHLVDIYFDICDGDRIFEWNLFHHPSILANSCMDIDGVLCNDPSPDVNDDGEKYVNFLLSAPPKFIPKVKVKTLISCRLEKYRKQTMFWLYKHQIKYDNLILLNLPTQDDRRRWGRHGEYKADEYKKPYSLFIESSINEATIIHNITHKSVFCVDAMKML